jgi:hypothetical protein
MAVNGICHSRGHLCFINTSFFFPTSLQPLHWNLVYRFAVKSYSSSLLFCGIDLLFLTKIDGHIMPRLRCSCPYCGPSRPPGTIIWTNLNLHYIRKLIYAVSSVYFNHSLICWHSIFTLHIFYLFALAVKNELNVNYMTWNKHIIPGYYRTRWFMCSEWHDCYWGHWRRGMPFPDFT